MARGIQNYPNTLFPGNDYPDGRSKDNPGDGSGTPVNELTLGDYQQFFAKMLREAVITANGLPDNEYNGNQYYQALMEAFGKRYVASMDQTSTGAPTGNTFGWNSFGSLTWTRVSQGVYQGTRSGAFPSSLYYLVKSTSWGNYSSRASVTSTNTVEVRTFDDTGTLADGPQKWVLEIYGFPTVGQL